MENAEGEQPEFGFLGQLFGPKGENEDLFVKLVTTVLLDYSYWRKNYFPDDPLVLTSALKRETEAHRDKLVEMTSSMVAKLRRSFPIYSPRYIGHQLSETTIASVIGAFAGTLYNCNNVTPEAGIETVEMEIEACNDILKLLGFRLPPPTEDAYKDYEKYTKDLENNFGWCHLTSGGTVANLEALWVARAVKFFPLALRDACEAGGIDLQVAPAGSPSELVESQDKPGHLVTRRTTISLTELNGRALLGFRPMEVLSMLGKATQILETEKALEERGGKTAAEYLWDLLNESPHSPKRGIGYFQRRFRPVIFTSGAAHYSIAKCADLLGLGRDAVVKVPMDRAFRLNIEALREAMLDARAEKCPRTILAIVGALGTTEEGAVDPIDQLVQLRREWEAEFGESFWIHVDGAWGGFMRSVFVDPASPHKLSLRNLGRTLSEVQEDVLAISPFFLDRRQRVEDNPETWFVDIVDQLVERLKAADIEKKPVLPDRGRIKTWFDKCQTEDDYTNILTVLEDVLHRAAIGLGAARWPEKKKYFEAKRRNLTVFAAQDASAYIIPGNSRARDATVVWPDKTSVGRSFLAVEDADSVTIDPHKMGYCVYPNGAVAYRSDIVRHFIKHEAPYITSESSRAGGAAGGESPGTRQRSGGHVPIRGVKEDDKGKKYTKTEAFAPYILEGSRPGAAACSLWLASKSLPLDSGGIGKIVTSSVKASRLLYHYLKNWDDYRDLQTTKGKFRFVPYSPNAPDTNIVAFAVLPEEEDLDLARFNKVNNEIYRKFSILAEHGNRTHSYMQRFFLSRTEFKHEKYPFEFINSFMMENNITCSREEYESSGITVLRATVMNPYLTAMREFNKDDDLLFDFVAELELEAMRVIGPADDPAHAGEAPDGEIGAGI